MPTLLLDVTDWKPVSYDRPVKDLLVEAIDKAQLLVTSMGGLHDRDELKQKLLKLIKEIYILNVKYCQTDRVNGIDVTCQRASMTCTVLSIVVRRIPATPSLSMLWTQLHHEMIAMLEEYAVKDEDQHSLFPLLLSPHQEWRMGDLENCGLFGLHTWLQQHLPVYSEYAIDWMWQLKIDNPRLRRRYLTQKRSKYSNNSNANDSSEMGSQNMNWQIPLAYLWTSWIVSSHDTATNQLFGQPSLEEVMKDCEEWTMFWSHYGRPSTMFGAGCALYLFDEFYRRLDNPRHDGKSILCSLTAEDVYDKITCASVTPRLAQCTGIDIRTLNSYFFMTLVLDSRPGKVEITKLHKLLPTDSEIYIDKLEESKSTRGVLSFEGKNISDILSRKRLYDPHYYLFACLTYYIELGHVHRTATIAGRMETCSIFDSTVSYAAYHHIFVSLCRQDRIFVNINTRDPKEELSMCFLPYMTYTGVDVFVELYQTIVPQLQHLLSEQEKEYLLYECHRCILLFYVSKHNHECLPELHKLYPRVPPIDRSESEKWCEREIKRANPIPATMPRTKSGRPSFVGIVLRGMQHDVTNTGRENMLLDLSDDAVAANGQNDVHDSFGAPIAVDDEAVRKISQEANSAGETFVTKDTNEDAYAANELSSYQQDRNDRHGMDVDEPASNYDQGHGLRRSLYAHYEEDRSDMKGEAENVFQPGVQSEMEVDQPDADDIYADLPNDSDTGVQQRDNVNLHEDDETSEIASETAADDMLLPARDDDDDMIKNDVQDDDDDDDSISRDASVIEEDAGDDAADVGVIVIHDTDEEQSSNEAEMSVDDRSDVDNSDDSSSNTASTNDSHSSIDQGSAVKVNTTDSGKLVETAVDETMHDATTTNQSESSLPQAAIDTSATEDAIGTKSKDEIDVDQGYDAEASQCHTEDEEAVASVRSFDQNNKDENPPIAATQIHVVPAKTIVVHADEDPGYEAEDSQAPEDEPQPIVKPKGNTSDQGYDAEDSQGHSEDEDEKVESRRRSTDDKDKSDIKSKSNASDQGYDAEDSQGHSEEDDERLESRRLSIDEKIEDEEILPGVVRVDVIEETVITKPASADLDPGYEGEESQGHSDDEKQVAQFEYDAEESQGHTEEEDDTSRAIKSDDEITRVAANISKDNVVTSPTLPAPPTDQPTLSDMSAADECTTGVEEEDEVGAEMSDIDEIEESFEHSREDIYAPQPASVQATASNPKLSLMQYAAAVQRDDDSRRAKVATTTTSAAKKSDANRSVRTDMARADTRSPSASMESAEMSISEGSVLSVPIVSQVPEVIGNKNDEIVDEYKAPRDDEEERDMVIEIPEEIRKENDLTELRNIEMQRLDSTMAVANPPSIESGSVDMSVVDGLVGEVNDDDALQDGLIDDSNQNDTSMTADYTGAHTTPETAVTEQENAANNDDTLAHASGYPVVDQVDDQSAPTPAEKNSTHDEEATDYKATLRQSSGAEIVAEQDEDEEKSDQPRIDEVYRQSIDAENIDEADQPGVEVADEVSIDKADQPESNDADEVGIDKADQPGVDVADDVSIDKADQSGANDADEKNRLIVNTENQDKYDDNDEDEPFHDASPVEQMARSPAADENVNDVNKDDDLGDVGAAGTDTNIEMDTEFMTPEVVNRDEPTDAKRYASPSVALRALQTQQRIIAESRMHDDEVHAHADDITVLSAHKADDSVQKVDNGTVTSVQRVGEGAVTGTEKAVDLQSTFVDAQDNIEGTVIDGGQSVTVGNKDIDESMAQSDIMEAGIINDTDEVEAPQVGSGIQGETTDETVDKNEDLSLRHDISDTHASNDRDNTADNVEGDALEIDTFVDARTDEEIEGKKEDLATDTVGGGEKIEETPEDQTAIGQDLNTKYSNESEVDHISYSSIMDVYGEFVNNEEIGDEDHLSEAGTKDVALPNNEIVATEVSDTQQNKRSDTKEGGGTMQLRVRTRSSSNVSATPVAELSQAILEPIDEQKPTPVPSPTRSTRSTRSKKGATSDAPPSPTRSSRSTRSKKESTTAAPPSPTRSSRSTRSKKGPTDAVLPSPSSSRRSTRNKKKLVITPAAQPSQATSETVDENEDAAVAPSSPARSTQSTPSKKELIATPAVQLSQGTSESIDKKESTDAVPPSPSRSSRSTRSKRTAASSRMSTSTPARKSRRLVNKTAEIENIAEVQSTPASKTSTKPPSRASTRTRSSVQKPKVDDSESKTSRPSRASKNKRKLETSLDEAAESKDVVAPVAEVLAKTKRRKKAIAAVKVEHNDNDHDSAVSDLDSVAHDQYEGITPRSAVENVSYGSADEVNMVETMKKLKPLDARSVASQNSNVAVKSPRKVRKARSDKSVKTDASVAESNVSTPSRRSTRLKPLDEKSVASQSSNVAVKIPYKIRKAKSDKSVKTDTSVAESNVSAPSRRSTRLAKLTQEEDKEEIASAAHSDAAIKPARKPPLPRKSTRSKK